MANLWRDFWIRETGTGKKLAQLHDRYKMMMMMMMMMIYYTEYANICIKYDYKFETLNRNISQSLSLTERQEARRQV